MKSAPTNPTITTPDWPRSPMYPLRLEASRPLTLGESLLKQPRQRIPQSGEHLPGTRKGEDVVPDLIIVSIPFNRESLFSALCVFPQRAVGEAKPLHRTFLIDDVD